MSIDKQLNIDPTDTSLINGFTLPELQLVIVIIGLLVAYVGRQYFSQIGKSEVSLVKAHIAIFDKALDAGRLSTIKKGMPALSGVLFWQHRAFKNGDVVA